MTFIQGDASHSLKCSHKQIEFIIQQAWVTFQIHKKKKRLMEVAFFKQSRGRGHFKLNLVFAKVFFKSVFYTT